MRPQSLPPEDAPEGHPLWLHEQHYSCRKIESSLKRDVHFIWLAGYEQPDFITINRFRNRVKDEINKVFTQLVLLLNAKGLVTLDVEYIDGTKIESKTSVCRNSRAQCRKWLHKACLPILVIYKKKMCQI